MIEYTLFKFKNNELITLFISSLPISELRGAIPLAILKFNFPWWKAYILSIIGNMIPIIPLLLLLESVSSYLRKFKIWDIFFNWLFTRTRRKSDLIEKYENLGLMLFVAIPLPATGAWTGCVAAFLFGIKFKSAFLFIFLGVMIAGILVTTLTLLGTLGAIITGIVLLILIIGGIISLIKDQKRTTN